MKILNDLEETVEKSQDMTLEKPNFEGVRVNVKDGWFLLRLSLHDPLMPLDIQCDHEETLAYIYSFLKDFLSKYDYIDKTPLK